MIKNVFLHKNQFGIGVWCGKPWEIGQKLDFRAVYSEIYSKIDNFPNFG